MITGQWFIRKVEDKQDLISYSNSNMINGDEYKDLKRIATNYINKRFYILRNSIFNKASNGNLWNYFYGLYCDVLKRMESIENE